MSRNITSGMATQVTAGALSPILLCELNFLSGYVRAWTGYGSLTWNGNTYLGIGDFGAVSATEESTDNRANNITFTLNGFDSALIATVLGDQYQGRSAKLWFGCLDSTNAVIADPFLLFSGRMDTVQISENGGTSSIAVTAESQLVDFTTPRIRRYTNADQQTYYPNDTGLSFIAALQGETFTWGKATYTGGNTPAATAPSGPKMSQWS